VLFFIGCKMLLIDFYKIPVLVSLGVVATVIAGTMVLSVLRPKVENTPS
jgi:tellurite resistance protein TerC